MPRSRAPKRPTRREERVSRTYRLPLSKVKAVQRALGAATASEAIERALDLVILQRELVNGTRAMLGVEIASPSLLGVLGDQNSFDEDFEIAALPAEPVDLP